MEPNKQIVCISTHYWDDAWFRKQHFMSRFVKNGYRVAYIEPSFALVKKPAEDKVAYQTNRPFSVSLDRKGDDLFILKPPQNLPYWTNPFMSRVNAVYQSFLLNNALQKLNFKEYLLWVYRPDFAPGLDMFDYRKIIFDLSDDLAAYKEEESNKYSYIKKCTESIVAKSDMFIVTASTLFDKYKNVSQNIHLIPNGYESQLFSDSVNGIAEDIKNIKAPIIGFIGTLFSFLDYELLQYIIKNNQDKSFVFIGGKENNAEYGWRKLMHFNNVHWLGKKRKEDIPSYVSNFDVCINPFRVDEVSRSVSPLKVFEYLAMKKPVISVKMESLEKEEVAPFIYFVESYEDFHDKLNYLLRNKDDFISRLDYEIVRAYSWDNLFSRVFAMVEKL